MKLAAKSFVYIVSRGGKTSIITYFDGSCFSVLNIDISIHTPMFVPALIDSK